MTGVPAAGPLWKKSTGLDVLCLAAITVASALPYLFRLGFYSDDWGLLAAFDFSRGGSLAALVGDNFPARPVQGLYLVSLYRLFGLAPLGYHIVNTGVIAGSAILFYLLLLRLRFSRAESFAVTVLFLMLPQLSTVRVWYSAFQIPLSMALMLVSMHCQLSFRDSRKAAWLAEAIIAAALSIAAYEIFAPLLVGFAGALLADAWRSRRRRDRRLIATTAVIAALFVAVVAYKLTFRARTGAVADPHRYILGLRQLVRLDYDWRVDSGLNLLAMLRTHLWAPVRGWWSGAEALLTARTAVAVAIIAVVIGLIAWWRLSAGEPRNEAVEPKRLLVVGIAAFLLGNATFLVVPSIAFTSTGIGNRVHVAAAIGVAMILASLIVFATRAFPPQLRQMALSCAIAVISLAAFVRLSAIETYWAEAPALQERILSAARADLRDIPAGSTVILDGVCPYDGPAVVFEADWDVGGALSLALGRQIAGNVVSPRMRVTANGLETSIYREPSLYPYGPQLFVYDPSKHLLLGLENVRSAATYFANRRMGPCPGFVARGVEV